MKNTIVLATYGKQKDHAHADCMFALRRELGVTVLETRGNPQLDIARSMLATEALDNGADVTVFIDSDILFDPLDVERLADAARWTRGVVGAPYARRGMNSGIVGSFVPEVGEVVFYEGGGLKSAPGVIGMGFTAIYRDAYLKLSALPEYEYVLCDAPMPIRPFFKKIVVENRWLHEDASFCHAVRSVGVATHMHTQFRVKHVGDYPFRLEDCLGARPDENQLKLALKPQ